MTNQLSHLKNHYKAEFEKIRELKKKNPNKKTKELLKQSGIPSSLWSRVAIVIEEEFK